MILNPVFIIPFHIIILHFLINISNANSSAEDKMLIAFVKNDKKVQISEFSKQKYEAYLGIMHFMRKNWQCDKIADEFEEYERSKCSKYRKYLIILYEYLCREYAGMPTVKPKFIFKSDDIEIEGPIIYAVNCLAKISQFYFVGGHVFKYKLNDLIFHYFGPKLLNEERLNNLIKLENKPKLPINEMILQLAIDTANEWQSFGNLDRIIRHKFEENVKEMLKKAKGNAIKGTISRGANELNDDMHLIIFDSKCDDAYTWIDDTLFSEFVKGLATKSVKFSNFFEIAKECSTNLCQLKNIEYINGFGEHEQMICEIEKNKKHLTQKTEAHLGIMYLMRENWHCDQIAAQLTEVGRNECQKYRKYLDILYEYVFQLYAEAKNPEVSKQLPPLVKPIFIKRNFQQCLIEAVKILHKLSRLFWQKLENKDKSSYYEMELVNAEEFNFEIKEEKNGQKGKQIFNGPTEIERIREEFKQKMAKMYENAKENAKKEKPNFWKKQWKMRQIVKKKKT